MIVFFVQKVTFFEKKSTKNCRNERCSFGSNMHQILGLRPRPHWGSLQCSQDIIAAFKGLRLRKGRQGKRLRGVREGKQRKGKGGKGEKGSLARPLYRCFRRLWSIHCSQYLVMTVLSMPNDLISQHIAVDQHLVIRNYYLSTTIHTTVPYDIGHGDH